MERLLSCVGSLISRLTALAVLILLSPVLLIVGALVYRDLGSPVFFVQKRTGLGGELFEFVKFRTMSNEVSSDGRLLPDVRRTSAVGAFLRKTSLDELPSLYNVLRGELSFVGPRPLLPEYLPLYSEFELRRHDVRPGITGWAQVNGRNSISWDERFKLDVWYVDNRSLWLDLKIIVLTIWTVFKQKGVYSESGGTMPKFKGSKR